MLYGLLKSTLLGPVLRVAFRPRTTGVEGFPDDGPVLLVANHQSFSDSLFMPLVAPRPVKFLAKSEYFTGSGVKVPLPKPHRGGGRVQVEFGAPLDFSRYTGPDGAAWRALEGTEAERAVLRAVTDEIMHTLMRMTGLEYVDVYASAVKKTSSKR